MTSWSRAPARATCETTNLASCPFHWRLARVTGIAQPHPPPQLPHHPLRRPVAGALRPGVQPRRLGQGRSPAAAVERPHAAVAAATSPCAPRSSGGRRWWRSTCWPRWPWTSPWTSCSPSTASSSPCCRKTSAGCASISRDGGARQDHGGRAGRRRSPLRLRRHGPALHAVDREADYREAWAYFQQLQVEG